MVDSHSTVRRRLIQRFDLDECADFAPRHNIPPGTDIPVIRQSPEGKRVLHLLRWGWVPHWAKDPSIGHKLNNARGESVAGKPSFRDAFHWRRCLIPADGFYEWTAQGKTKQPYYISLKSGELLAMGGLLESWRGPNGEVLRAACIVTTGPNTVMEAIHDRVPVILRPEDWQTWLDAPVEAVQPLLRLYESEDKLAWLVDRRVSKIADDDAGLVAPIEMAGLLQTC